MPAELAGSHRHVPHHGDGRGPHRASTTSGSARRRSSTSATWRWREREAMMLHELERFDEGLFYCLFDTPDRVQHLFWRLPRARPPGQPRQAAPAPVRRGSSRTNTGGAMRSWARRSSSPIATPWSSSLSDHGFGSFQRGVNLNTLLLDEGLLALKTVPRPGHGCRDFLLDVDWSKTGAYALGLGGIYLNLEGREARGMVKADGGRGAQGGHRRQADGAGRPGSRRRGRAPRARRASPSTPALSSTRPPTCSSTSRGAIGPPGARRWAGSPRAISRTTPRSGAAITSSIPSSSPASCS